MVRGTVEDAAEGTGAGAVAGLVAAAPALALAVADSAPPNEAELLEDGGYVEGAVFGAPPVPEPGRGPSAYREAGKAEFGAAVSVAEREAELLMTASESLPLPGEEGRPAEPNPEDAGAEADLSEIAPIDVDVVWDPEPDDTLVEASPFASSIEERMASGPRTGAEDDDKDDDKELPPPLTLFGAEAHALDPVPAPAPEDSAADAAADDELRDDAADPELELVRGLSLSESESLSECESECECVTAPREAAEAVVEAEDGVDDEDEEEDEDDDARALPNRRSISGDSSASRPSKLSSCAPPNLRGDSDDTSSSSEPPGEPGTSLAKRADATSPL